MKAVVFTLRTPLVLADGCLGKLLFHWSTNKYCELNSQGAVLQLQKMAKIIERKDEHIVRELEKEIKKRIQMGLVRRKSNSVNWKEVRKSRNSHRRMYSESSCTGQSAMHILFVLNTLWMKRTQGVGKPYSHQKTCRQNKYSSQ